MNPVLFHTDICPREPEPRRGTCSSEVYWKPNVCWRSRTGGVGAQLQAGRGPGEDQLESLGSLWNVVVNDLHLHELVPLAIHEMEHLDAQRMLIQWLMCVDTHGATLALCL